MELSIVLSNSEGNPYTPGSLVLGVVKLVVLTDQPMGSVAISFVGRSKVLLVHSFGDMTTSRYDYKSCGYLFCRHLNLYRGKYTHAKGTYEWPFVFRVPDIADSPLDGYMGLGDTFDHTSPWRGSDAFDPHPLPPSMNHAGMFHCSVEYVLHATLIRPPIIDIPFSYNIGVSKLIDVRYLPPPIDSNLGSEWSYRAYHHLIPFRPVEHPHSMKDRLISIIRDRKPSAVTGAAQSQPGIQICVLVPKAVEINADAPIPIHISATSLGSTEPTASDNPAEVPFSASILKIKKFTISILIHTKVRAGCHHPYDRKNVCLGQGTCDISVMRGLQSEQMTVVPTVLPTNSVNLGELAQVRLSSGKLVPGFSTYNIFRFYALEMRFLFEYAHKRSKFTIKDIPIRIESHIVPSTDTRTTGLDGLSMRGPPIDDDDDNFDQPPQYRP